MALKAPLRKVGVLLLDLIPTLSVIHIRSITKSAFCHLTNISRLRPSPPVSTNTMVPRARSNPSSNKSSIHNKTILLAQNSLQVLAPQYLTDLLHPFSLITDEGSDFLNFFLSPPLCIVGSLESRYIKAKIFVEECN